MNFGGHLEKLGGGSQNPRNSKKQGGHEKTLNWSYMTLRKEKLLNFRLFTL